MVYILIISVLILPWLFIPSNNVPDPTRLIKATFFDFTMMAIIVSSLITGVKYKYKNIYLALLSAWIFITIGFNWYYHLLVGHGYNAGTIQASIHYILALIATILVCSTFDGDDFIKLSKTISFSALLVSLFACLQVFGLDPMLKISKYVAKETRHIAALLDHPDLLGNYLAISIPFMLYFNKWQYYLICAISLFIIIMTKSSLSILAAIFGIGIFLYLKFKDKKYTNIITISSIALFGLFCLLNPSFTKIHNGFTGRINAWQEIVGRIDNYIFGQGLGIVKSLQVTIGNNYWAFAHNDYLEIFCSLGGLGLALLTLLIINSFVNFKYKKENVLGFSYLASFVAFLIICFGSFPMEIAPLALTGLIAFWGVEKL